MRGLSLAQPLLFQAPTMLDGARRMFGFGLWLGAWTATAGGCSGEIKGTAAAALAGDSSVGTLGVDGASSNPGSTQPPDTAPGCRVPQTHVAQPFSCSMAAGYPADATPMSCESTSDCPEAGGIESEVASNCLHGQCSPSACLDSDDCASGGVCSCQGSTRGYAGSSPGNVCVPANCRSDADCGPNGYCSPTVSATCGAFYGVQGYYCHHCGDACVNDSDCSDSGSSYCAYDPTVGQWACESGFCAG
ncbi:MAG TPA: hypothetical protein VEK07_23470 [Polyangiaceae bacterium]|nr:hypothetical protein [Polyangiaceae bacterium]